MKDIQQAAVLKENCRLCPEAKAWRKSALAILP